VGQTYAGVYDGQVYWKRDAIVVSSGLLAPLFIR
jgi:hypothetical protein